MRKLALLEPILMFGLIIAYIWKLRFTHPNSWIVIPILMFLSHLLRRESPRALGLDVRNWRNGLNQVVRVLIVTSILLLSAGALFYTFRQVSFQFALLSLAAYLPWGLVQQYALNGYFLNRFQAVFSNHAASLLAALFFSAAHTPNVFLMVLTLPLGWCATIFYLRTRNLYLLGIAHAIIGLLLFLVVPDSLSHHMRVGPGWFVP
jgi:membrane protease YdiL (CAAX protease family)